MTQRLTPQLIERLDKILALADSDQPGEALLAVRKARQMLAEAGMNFSDLIKHAVKPRLSLGRRVAVKQDEPPLLREQLADAESCRHTQDAALQAARRRIHELEARLAHSQSEAQRWHQLARDTVDTLWDMGGGDAFSGSFLPTDTAQGTPRKTA